MWGRADGVFQGRFERLRILSQACRAARVRTFSDQPLTELACNLLSRLMTRERSGEKTRPTCNSLPSYGAGPHAGRVAMMAWTVLRRVSSTIPSLKRDPTAPSTPTPSRKANWPCCPSRATPGARRLSCDLGSKPSEVGRRLRTLQLSSVPIRRNLRRPSPRRRTSVRRRPHWQGMFHLASPARRFS